MATALGQRCGSAARNVEPRSERSGGQLPTPIVRVFAFGMGRSCPAGSIQIDPSCRLASRAALIEEAIYVAHNADADTAAVCRLQTDTIKWLTAKIARDATPSRWCPTRP